MLRLASLLLLVTPVHAEPFEAPALIRSKARLELRSTLALPVSRAPLREGQRFAKGDRLLAFDCRTLAAERRAAKAGARAAGLEAKAKRRLLAHGAAGRGEVERAAAVHAQASARRDALAAKMSSCEWRASFAGRVVRLGARPGEVPRAGEPVLTVIDDTRLDVELVAPSRWLSWIEPGATFTVAIEETGRSFPTTIETLGAEVDPVSRTVRLYGSVPTGAGVLPGMSGQATLRPTR